MGFDLNDKSSWAKHYDTLSEHNKSILRRTLKIDGFDESGNTQFTSDLDEHGKETINLLLTDKKATSFLFVLKNELSKIRNTLNKKENKTDADKQFIDKLDGAQEYLLALYTIRTMANADPANKYSHPNIIKALGIIEKQKANGIDKFVDEITGLVQEGKFNHINLQKLYGIDTTLLEQDFRENNKADLITGNVNEEQPWYVKMFMSSERAKQTMETRWG